MAHVAVNRSGAAALRLAATAALLCLAGCAATTIFVPYPDKINPLIGNIQEKKGIDPLTLASECLSRDRVIYSLERGRLRQILGQTDPSMDDFLAALTSMREDEQRATVSLSGIGAQAAGLAVNDNALPYAGEGYERVMLHHFQALNHLARGDLEAAGVEIRRANAEQEEALRRHEREIARAGEAAETHQLAAWDPNQVLTEYAGLDEIAGQVKNSFQNAYTFYLSGLVYEQLGQPNDAYIDYKKALEIYPGNIYLQRDVLRLAETLQMDQDLESFRRRFPPGAFPPATGRKAGEGELVILFEDGFVPQKEQVKIPLPVIDSEGVTGWTGVAFPIYRPQQSGPSSLTVLSDSRELGKTEPIADFRTLAVKALREKLPSMVIRQMIRTTIKAATAKMAKEKFGSLGEFGSSLYNLGSENADLRSWVTLPAQAQILRASLPAGSRRLSLAGTGESATEVEVEIREQATTVLYLVRAGQQLYSSKFSF